MLNKKNKFSTTDFVLIKKLKPKKIFTNIGVFCVYPTLSADQTESKFAIVPTKKIFKTAVLRNRHKRLFFNSCQNLDFTDLRMSLIFYPNKIFTREQVREELSKIVL